jgi:hypothetical protein
MGELLRRDRDGAPDVLAGRIVSDQPADDGEPARTGDNGEGPRSSTLSSDCADYVRTTTKNGQSAKG